MNHDCLHNNHNNHNHSHFGIIGYNVFGSETLKRWRLNLNSRVTFKFCYFLLFPDCECIEKSPQQNEGSIIRRIFAMCVPCWSWILNANLSMVLLNSFVRARLFLSDMCATVHRVVDRGSILSHISNMNFQFWAVLGMLHLSFFYFFMGKKKLKIF